MEKIPTLFERSTSGMVFDSLSPHVMVPNQHWVGYEKLDGANVRLTVRSGKLVRLEARRNPTKSQKTDGIVHPWYRDAEPEGSKSPDMWLWDAARATDLTSVPDGEWSGEAVGPKIQGNPLDLEERKVYLFSLIPWVEHLDGSVLVPPRLDAPLFYESLIEWLPAQKSRINPAVTVEGVVWWMGDVPVAKLKVKDFKRG